MRSRPPSALGTILKGVKVQGPREQFSPWSDIDQVIFYHNQSKLQENMSNMVFNETVYVTSIDKNGWAG